MSNDDFRKTPRPHWWPPNPYPVNVFTATDDDYVRLVPETVLRTAISGMLGREFFEMASTMIWMAMQNHLEDLEEAIMAAVLSPSCTCVINSLKMGPHHMRICPMYKHGDCNCMARPNRGDFNLHGPHHWPDCPLFFQPPDLNVSRET